MKQIFLILSVIVFLTGCGGSTTPTVAVTGHVSGTDGIATSIGAGATVNLIQIDNQGVQVGGVIVTTSTDVGGDYTLNVPTTYSPATSYAITANDGSSTIEAIWTSNVTDISVITDATKELLFNSSSPVASSLSSIAATTTNGIDINEVLNTEGIVAELTKNGSDKVQNVKDDQEAFDQTLCPWGSYNIKGQVTDSNGSAVSGAKVFARDFSNHEKRCSTFTLEDGSYNMDLELNEGYEDKMIVGIMNRTDSSMAASEFYTDASPATGSGTKCGQPHCGQSITISKSTSQVLDFQLAAGSRITGTITGGASNTKLEGVKIRFRDSLSRRFRGAVRSDVNGEFNFNIAPGSYIAYIMNDTELKYGSVAWTNNGGHVDRNYGGVFTTVADQTTTLNMNLSEGGTIKGIVCSSGVACVESPDYQFKKMKIRKFYAIDRFNNNIEFDTDTVRSNSRSKFRLQVPYGKYRVNGNGKNYDNGGAYYTIDATNDLDLSVNHTTLTAKIKVIDSDGNPLPSIGVKFRNYKTGTRIGTSTFSDGTGQVDVDTSDSSKFYIGLSSREGLPFAACNYDGTNCSTTALGGDKENHTWADGNASNADIVGYTRDMALNPGTLTLQMPAGFAVTGTITDTDGTAAANASLSYYVKDTLKDNSQDWRSFTWASTGSDGKYSMSLAANTNYQFRSRLDNDTRIEFRGIGANGCSITAASTKDFDYTDVSSTGRYRLFDCTFTTPAMPHTISGSVTDHNGATLAKALVRIDIKTISDDTLFRRIEAITDDNGAYSIKVPEDSSSTYYYKFRGFYDLAFNVIGYWDPDGSIGANYIEYGKNNNCSVTGNKTINFNAVTANLDGTDNKRYTSCP
jgi:protocatechuate 3,4-dioxygenase beta subunit